MRILTRVFAVGISVLIAGGLISPAFARNTASYWNYADVPLTKSGYGSTVRAYGYQKISSSTAGTRLFVTTYHKFTDGDNHAAYVNGITQFNAGYCRDETVTIIENGVEVSKSYACVKVFFDRTSYRQNGANYTETAWVKMPDANLSVQPNGDRGRVIVQVGIDVPLRTDPVSGWSISDADTY